MGPRVHRLHRLQLESQLGSRSEDYTEWLRCREASFLRPKSVRHAFEKWLGLVDKESSSSLSALTLLAYLTTDWIASIATLCVQMNETDPYHPSNVENAVLVLSKADLEQSSKAIDTLLEELKSS